MQIKSLRYFYVSMCLALPLGSWAQVNSLGDKGFNKFEDTKKNAKERNHQSSKKSRRASVYRPPKVQHTAVYEYYERMERVAKEKQKLLRKLSKPQYSNPLYFGHRRPPKKHRPDKMRYCSECGIRH